MKHRKLELAPEFFKDEWLDGFAVRHETKEVWAVNLDLVAYLQEVCEAKHLRYFMGFGTLLGAFRHSGFVPWDDDVDILMPREDFERLKEFAGEFEEPYFLQHDGNDPGYWHRGMMKLRRSDTCCIEWRHKWARFNQGIGIEILPLDALANDLTERHIEKMTSSVLQRLLWAKLFGRDAKKEDQWGDPTARPQTPKWLFYRFMSHFWTEKGLKRRIFRNATRYAKESTEFLGIMTSYGGRVAEFHREDFAEKKDLPFGPLRLPAPIGYWRALETFYGDWFYKEPPAEVRVPHHPALWDTREGYARVQERFRGALHPKDGATVVLFGTGNMVGDYLRRTKKLPDFFADNDRRKWGTEFHGRPVKGPEALLEIPKEKRHIILCNNYYRQIGRQLKSMGIDDYYIYTDDWRTIFTTPNGIGQFEDDFACEPKIACITGRPAEWEMGAKLFARLRAAHFRCAYLIAVVVGQPDDAQAQTRRAILQELDCVDRAILLPEATEERLTEGYHAEVTVRLSDTDDVWREAFAVRQRARKAEQRARERKEREKQNAKR